MADTNITPSTGSLSLAGRRPPPLFGPYALTGTDVAATRVIGPFVLAGTDTGGVRLTYELPGATIPINVPKTPGTGSLSFAGQAPLATLFNTEIRPNVRALAIATFAPTLVNSSQKYANPVQGALALAGAAPAVAVKSDTQITPASGSLAFAGAAPSLFATSTIPLLLRTLTASGGPGSTASFRLLLRTIDASAVMGVVADLSFTTPLRTITATGNDGAAFTTPLRTLSASGVMGVKATAAFNLLQRTLSARGTVTNVGNAAFSLLLRRLDSSGVHGNVANAAFDTPLRTLSASGTAGVIANAAPTLLLRTLVASDLPSITASASFTLPLRFINAIGDPALASHFRAWVMNTRTRSLVEYGNYSFNSLAKFNGQQLAAGPGGLFVLGGTTDNTTAIASTVRTGLNDYGSSFLKRVPRIYVSLQTTGNMLFKTISSLNETRTYRLTANGISKEQQRRVPIGKGPKAERWQYEWSNESGADFGVSRMIVYPYELRRRIQR